MPIGALEINLSKTWLNTFALIVGIINSRFSSPRVLLIGGMGKPQGRVLQSLLNKIKPSVNLISSFF